jgi:hypothetical protein
LLVKGDGDAMEYDEDESDSGEGEEDDGNWHDKAAKSVAFLSLSANGNPTYVGASSGFSWARFVLAYVHLPSFLSSLFFRLPFLPLFSVSFLTSPSRPSY